jgi:hypothetical protein
MLGIPTTLPLHGKPVQARRTVRAALQAPSPKIFSFLPQSDATCPNLESIQFRRGGDIRGTGATISKATLLQTYPAVGNLTGLRPGVKLMDAYGAFFE